MNRYRSFEKNGKGLGLAKKLRRIAEDAGFHGMPITTYDSAIRSGRYPAGTLAFAIVDSRDRRPRFLGTVVVHERNVFFEGDDVRELEAILVEP